MIEVIKKYIPFKKYIKMIRKEIKKAKISSFFSNVHKEFFFKNDLFNLINIEKNTEPFQRGFLKGNDYIIKYADEVCDHIFDLLGSGKINLGKKINWQCDFKSGYCWNPKTFYLDIEYGKIEGVDVKVPWELSRFQHFAILGEAYQLSKNEKYAQEFVNEINNWIDENPMGYGVNWKCTMDVAIRVCNWILAYDFFKNSEKITNEFLQRFLQNLFCHGKFIENNLEKSFLSTTSNHYLSDIAGLAYLGMFFKDKKQGKKWLNFSINELKREMKKQVYEDGCDFEASTCYHRLVLELFFFSTLFTVVNDVGFTGENYKKATENIFGAEYTGRLYKMFETVLYLLKPNGKIPQIGDNDNGRLHIFTDGEILDLRYLLSFGAIFFNEPKFKIKEFELCEDALWVFGKQGYNIWRKLKENNLGNIKSRNFSNAGWFVMRNNKNYCIISCGPNGQNGNGGHCHNDKLSFELFINGQDVIVDSGNFVYTSYPEQRNKFRSTAHHNTVCVDGKEQNNFIKNNLFFMENNSKAECLKWETNEDKDIFVGEHHGYNPVVHQRKIEFYRKENKIEVFDIFKGEGKHDLEWNFYINNRQDINFSLDKKINWENEETDISPSYGYKTLIQKMSGKYIADISNVFCQIIRW
ncbi:MAG: alginate lyase family protein [Candidatus Staskawiczbacteria bacterium]|nr:alginate lyase family protein [Candidatus Staskawiczbacteria bacterium]